MVRLMAATPLLVLGLLALGGCVTHTDRPLYASSPAYYDPYWPGYHGPPAYYQPYYAPRPHSSFTCRSDGGAITGITTIGTVIAIGGKGDQSVQRTPFAVVSQASSRGSLLAKTIGWGPASGFGRGSGAAVTTGGSGGVAAVASCATRVAGGAAGAGTRGLGIVPGA